MTKPRFIDPLVPTVANPYHVLSIEEFESLMAAESNYGVLALLDLAAQASDEYADFRSIFAAVYREQRKPFHYGRLKALQDGFFSQFIVHGPSQPQ